MFSPRLILSLRLSKSHLPGALCLLAWACLVGVGMGFLMRYEQRPGSQPASPELWPTKFSAELDRTRANLVVFAHPRCPCTRATVTELEQIVRRCGNRVRVVVYFYEPASADADWTEAPLWKQARAIPGVEVRADIDGTAAQIFSAETSGQSLLFAKNGQRLFAGGITGGRGHQGENAGENAVIAAILGAESTAKNTSVFGCSLTGTAPRTAASL